jgi:FlaA1/EpsC-like NDP-sugar epimerase
MATINSIVTGAGSIGAAIIQKIISYFASYIFIIFTGNY